MNQKRSYRTSYSGHQFRSRTEASVALLFDSLRIGWVYERVSFLLPSGEFVLPDFTINTQPLLVEVKGVLSAAEACDLAELSDSRNVVVVMSDGLTVGRFDSDPAPEADGSAWPSFSIWAAMHCYDRGHGYEASMGGLHILVESGFKSTRLIACRSCLAWCFDYRISDAPCRSCGAFAGKYDLRPTLSVEDVLMRGRLARSLRHLGHDDDGGGGGWLDLVSELERLLHEEWEPSDWFKEETDRIEADHKESCRLLRLISKSHGEDRARLERQLRTLSRWTLAKMGVDGGVDSEESASS